MLFKAAGIVLCFAIFSSARPSLFLSHPPTPRPPRRPPFPWDRFLFPISPTRPGICQDRFLFPQPVEIACKISLVSDKLTNLLKKQYERPIASDSSERNRQNR